MPSDEDKTRERLLEELEALRREVAELGSSEAQLRSEAAEQELAKEALRQSELLLNSIVENIPDMIFVKDAEDLRFVRFNKAGERLLGYSRDDLLGKCDHDFFPKDEADFFTRNDRAVLGSGDVLDIPEEPIKTRLQGTRILHTKKVPLLNEEGRPQYLLGISEDITKRKQAEEARRESEVRLRTMFEDAPLGIALIDSSTGHIYEVNPRFAEIAGRTREAMATIDWMSITHPDDVQEDLDNMALLNAGRITGFKMNKRYIRPDGSTVWIEMTIAPVAVKDNAKPRHLAMIEDITKRLDLERQLQRAQKLESLGVLAGGIAHDFNNLLQAVLGQAELAYDDLPSHSPVRTRVSKVLKAARQAADLANQMLAYSGKGHFVVDELDLNALVREMASLLESSISKRVGLKREFSDDLPAIKADASQIRQIVVNLITNGSDAVGEEGGLVTVRTGMAEYDRVFLDEIQADLVLPEGRYVSFEVSDTGCGIDEETKARIFEPFFTTKFTGRGLGLAAVQGIVRGHKGGIWIESEPGVGTTFKVLFPALDHQTEPTEKRAAQETDWRGSGTVLVVDDEELLRDLATDVLEQVGFTVLTASDGAQAVDLFRERHAEIDCVLLDLKMPRMGGEEAFEELRKIRADVPVILSSGYSEEESTKQFAGRGLAGFLQKPYALEDLKRNLREVLGG